MLIDSSSSEPSTNCHNFTASFIQRNIVASTAKMRWANICLALSLATGSVANKHQAKYEEVTYTTVGGYFLQDDPSTNPSSFDYVSGNDCEKLGGSLFKCITNNVSVTKAQVNLGLLNRTYPTDHSFDRHNQKPQWAKFARWVEYLNKNCRNRSKRDRTVYKVLIMGRHGQGWHNAAESYYGTPAWNVSISRSSERHETYLRDSSATGLSLMAMGQQSGLTLN